MPQWDLGWLDWGSIGVRVQGWKERAVLRVHLHLHHERVGPSSPHAQQGVSQRPCGGCCHSHTENSKGQKLLELPVGNRLQVEARADLPCWRYTFPLDLVGLCCLHTNLRRSKSCPGHMKANHARGGRGAPATWGKEGSEVPAWGENSLCSAAADAAGYGGFLRPPRHPKSPMESPAALCASSQPQQHVGCLLSLPFLRSAAPTQGVRNHRCHCR